MFFLTFQRIFVTRSRLGVNESLRFTVAGNSDRYGQMEKQETVMKRKLEMETGNRNAITGAIFSS